ncbi:leucine-rich repeat-containing protein 19-like isoform X2 [Phyllopteryx taeniolatus]|uniref:leucine-rich repeat-containing protein 19-like isoform X2 n=1 Tax=Phyllopteryx taeniolatus TaxID=161469 RepID=UPI002AD2B367|nr:leucine-rich repeat-containing protein 19-like isoform X2 [Phyllopteryx taeniolatus]
MWSVLILNTTDITINDGEQRGTMGQPQQFLRLLWLVSFVAIYTKNNDAAVAVEDTHVHNLTDKSLKTIPPSISNSSVTSLVIERNQITLTSGDRHCLASYPRLVALHLDGNQVTHIPARYLSVVPKLSVLSLSRNQISSLQPESFYGLNDLTVLNLSHNLLTSLPAKLFSKLNNLQTVDLQDNPWNCSCQLLSTIEEIRAAGVTIVGSNIKCASPEQQAGMHLFEALTKCYPTSSPSSTVDPQNPPTGTTGHSQQPKVSKMMLTTSPNNSDEKHVSGNTWRFTACVAALALTTSMLIVCAIKAPSWYRLFRNYRHRRLRQEENRQGRTASSIYSETGRYMNHQTFTFEHHGAEGEEDVHYFEDPYIKTEE